MAIFQAHPGMVLTIGSDEARYEFLLYQFLPDDEADVCVVEGQEAFVYALRNTTDSTLWALKIFKPSYQSTRIIDVTHALLQYRNTPGLYLGHRICIRRPEYEELLAKFPGLEYGILMPWLSWKSWGGLMRSPQASATYTLTQAINLAKTTVRVLSELEQRGWAHTDIAGNNILYAADFTRVELIDLEGIYTATLPLPRRLSYGTPGYQHKKLGRNGQYVAQGDRFAGAILLTEMLTWWNPLVRAQTPANAASLFSEAELQQMNNSRRAIVRDVLWALHPELLALFDQAWSSSNLNQCPPFSTWQTTINSIKV